MVDSACENQNAQNTHDTYNPNGNKNAYTTNKLHEKKRDGNIDSKWCVVEKWLEYCGRKRRVVKTWLKICGRRV